MSAEDAGLSNLQAAVRDAIAAGDARAESVARVNIAYAYLQLESPQAAPAFEEALSSVRRAQNARSEGLLSMAFAPYFADQGDPARALELAQRGEELMRNGRIGHRVLANIQLARVLYTGFADAEQAGQAVDIAASLLAEGEIMNPTDREMVIQAAGPAAKAALQAGDTARTIALMRIIDPEAAARLERQRPTTVSGLTADQHQDAAQLYRDWQSRWSSRTANPRVASLNQKALDILRWDKASARTSGSSKDAEAVCAFIEYVQAAGGRPVPPASTSLTDDDLVFVVTLASDPEFSGVVAVTVVFELVAASASSPALVGRCYRLAAAIGHERRPPAETLALLQRADAVLADGADEGLHAEVVNEIAVCLLNLRQATPALQAAQRATTLSQRAREGRLERMARGNVANALLQLQRIAEALQTFEQLARDQDGAGETDMADISRQNIDACRNYLRARGEAV
jgi:tetratricopeptide (TPR) repeat protein